MSFFRIVSIFFVFIVVCVSLVLAEPVNNQSQKDLIQQKIKQKSEEAEKLQKERDELVKQLEEENAELKKNLEKALITRDKLIEQIEEVKKAIDADARKAAEANKSAPKPNAVLMPVADVPGLPRVLLIGDSISMGYTLPVRKLLAGKANVHRPLTNCGPTINGIKNLDAWLTDKQTGGDAKWDVIHFNFGLHDIKFIDANGKLVQVASEGKRQVSIEDYEKHLRTIVAKLKATGAKLIWCTTTPVSAGAAGRIPGDEVRYNEVALKVMKENDVAIDDLYAFAKPKVETIQNKKDVHFNEPGSVELAKQVVATIEAALKK